MAKKPLTEVVRVLFDELSPYDSDERKRAMQSVMVLLGETASPPMEDGPANSGGGELAALSGRAKNWVLQNGLSIGQLEQVFHFENGQVELIASIPGKNNKEKVRNAYVLYGFSLFLLNGEQRFDDAGARTICERHGFYDHTNHSKYLKDGNEFSGSKDKGWILTPGGMKHAASLIVGLAQ